MYIDLHTAEGLAHQCIFILVVLSITNITHLLKALLLNFEQTFGWLDLEFHS